LQAGRFCRDAALKKVSRIHVMNDRPANTPGPAEAPSADVDAATRRLMAALDALETAVERRREADRDEDELATRIQALGADRSRLADELDGSLVKSRKLERANREIAEKLDAAIGSIRAVLGAGGATPAHAHEPEDAEAEDE
jgi:ABC-type transporter Mla subunit MlaD